jgi:hypothetical protein
MRWKIFFFIVHLFWSSALIFSNDPFKLPRIRGQVKIDGLIDESAWEGIKSLPVFMHIPTFGDPPTEKTEILIAYDDNHLYLAGRLYTSNPKDVQGTSKKRDDLSVSSDWFGVAIDTFNDKENALIFITTPTGLRLDMTVSNDAQGEFPINMSWNTFWDTAVSRNEKGWFAEIRIPFSSLRFQNKEGDVVMGLSAWRYMPRKNEVDIFPKIPNKWDWGMFKPSQFREVVFKGIKSRKPIYLAPYLLAGYGQSFELNDMETAYQQSNDPVFELGLDFKYGLTSNLTLDLTINTDFAQVEADDLQVNLTRFSLFFPEKRLFFQERSSIFDFNFGEPNRLFYSRRIGIDEDENQVPIYGGLRMIGRIGSWDLGFLSMQTAPTEELSTQNFSVFRIRRRIFNPYSYLGTMVTSKIGKNGTYNIAYGVDGIFRLFEDDYLRFNWAQTFDDEEENKFTSLNPARIRVSWERRTNDGLAYDLSYTRSGATYNPEMGFEMREDYTRFGNAIKYGWIPEEKSFLQRHNVFLTGFIFIRNEDQTTESAEIGSGWAFATKKGYWGQISFKHYYEDVTEGFSFEDEDEEDEELSDPDVPIGQYKFYAMEAHLMLAMGKPLWSEANLYVGSFYDGWRLSLGMSPRWSVSPSLELSGTYQINRIKFPDRNKDFYFHITRLRILYMLNTKLSASAFIQYNNSSHEVITNIRLRYNPKEGNDLYLVYNEGLNTNRYRDFPTLPFRSDRTIMLKYTYTFKL